MMATSWQIYRHMHIGFCDGAIRRELRKRERLLYLEVAGWRVYRHRAGGDTSRDGIHAIPRW